MTGKINYAHPLTTVNKKFVSTFYFHRKRILFVRHVCHASLSQNSIPHRYASQGVFPHDNKRGSRANVGNSHTWIDSDYQLWLLLELIKK